MEYILLDVFDKEVITEEIINIIRTQMEFIGSQRSNKQIASFLQEYLRKESNAKLLILKKDSIVGFAFFNISVGLETNGKYIWLNEVHILNEFRNHGYGNDIIEFLDNYVKENNIKKIMGLISNENSAKNFYENNKFSLNEYILFSK